MNYYNENDPKAAQWLRNLVSAGFIPPGHVDKRSITEVTPNDLTGYTQCHFFAGIGGWSLALKLAGIDPSTRLWTGSCPCQPFSAAGKRKGAEDERHLWPVFRDLIAQCRPPVVLGEQVASADGRNWFAAVRADLEALGYGVGAADLCAAGIGAPHIRQRLYFVGLADSDSERHHGIDPLLRTDAAGWNQKEMPEAPRCCENGRVADTRGNGRKQGGSGAALLALPGEQAPAQSERREQAVSSERGSRLRGLADTDDAGPQGRIGMPECAGQCVAGEGSMGGGLADSFGSQFRRESGSGTGTTGAAQGAARERERGGSDNSSGGSDDSMADTGRPGPPDSFWSAADWLHCRDGKWRPVESGAFPLANGIPGRVGRLRAYGNAIVPQVAATFIRAAFTERKTD